MQEFFLSWQIQYQIESIEEEGQENLHSLNIYLHIN